MPSDNSHVILIDGRSGVGKTTLSLLMADALGATVVHLDDVYPGWGGLADGRDAVIDGVLRNIVDGRAGRVRRWDWEHSTAGIDVIVPPAGVLIVEGCGISTPKSRAMADTVIWVDCPDATRRERLNDRDGDLFDDHRDIWDAQVERHIADNDPIETATVTVNS
ncbi:MAG: AAA family ATPase [Microbacteriaceae bacterium]